MNVLDIVRTVGPVDIKNVRRDALLLYVPLLPLIIAMVFRAGVPPLRNVILTETGFDFAPYYPLLLSTFVVLAPTLSGFIAAFLLLDERDENMLTAILITPMPLNGYLLYRVMVPVTLGFLMTPLCYPLIGLVPLRFIDLLGVAALASFMGPVTTLAVAAFAADKVGGFAMLKMLNGVNMFPMLAFFLPLPFRWAAGVVPSYWPLQAFWLAAEGQPYVGYLIVGLVVNLLFVWLLLGRFRRVVYR